MNDLAIANYYDNPFVDGLKMVDPVTTPKIYGEWLMRQPRKKLKGWQKILKNRKKKKH